MVKETPKKAKHSKRKYHPNLEDKMTIISYYEQLKKAAEASEWSYSFVQSVVKPWKDENSTAQKNGSGRPRKTSPKEYEYIVHQVKRSRQITLEKITIGCPKGKVSRILVSRRINENSELSTQWKHAAPYISNKNRIQRLKWCKESLTWTKEKWRQILWSDESPFALRYNRASRVRRAKSEKNETWVMKETVNHDQKIMV